VGDGGGMQALFEKIRTPDLTIANAGISVGTSGGRNRVEIDRRILQTNLDGVVNTIYPAIGALIGKPRPESGPRGQIAIMSSLATFNGYPGAAAYGASKAAVRSLGEALRAERYRDGIEICVICPGFIRSNITDKNNFRMPFFMEAKRAARIIQRGLARNRGRIAFPWQTYWVARLAGTLPSGLRDALVRRMKS
jgi:short-subunit dehydrogenase